MKWRWWWLKGRLSPSRAIISMATEKKLMHSTLYSHMSCIGRVCDSSETLMSRWLINHLTHGGSSIFLSVSLPPPEFILSFWLHISCYKYKTTSSFYIHIFLNFSHTKNSLAGRFFLRFPHRVTQDFQWGSLVTWSRTIHKHLYYLGVFSNGAIEKLRRKLALTKQGKNLELDYSTPYL